MFKHATAIVVGGLVFGGAQPALAGGKDFCKKGDKFCVSVEIKNNASVVVKSVKISEAGPSGKRCSGNRTINYSRNLAKGKGYDVRLSGYCNYKINFKTTGGCAGDKKTFVEKHLISPTAGDLRTVFLDNACGSLKVKKTFENAAQCGGGALCN